MMKIMFVCTANTCRSAMAEAIFKSMVDDDIQVYSAGINADTGRSASKNTVESCKIHGLDVSGHTATNIKDSNILEMDLVLTATWEHKKYLEEKLGSQVKIYTIREFAIMYPYDIPDPFGYNLNSYNACFEVIYSSLEKVKKRLTSM